MWFIVVFVWCLGWISVVVCVVWIVVRGIWLCFVGLLVILVVVWLFWWWFWVWDWCVWCGLCVRLVFLCVLDWWLVLVCRLVLCDGWCNWCFCFLVLGCGGWGCWRCVSGWCFFCGDSVGSIGRNVCSDWFCYWWWVWLGVLGLVCWWFVLVFGSRWRCWFWLCSVWLAFGFVLVWVAWFCSIVNICWGNFGRYVVSWILVRYVWYRCVGLCCVVVFFVFIVCVVRFWFWYCFCSILLGCGYRDWNCFWWRKCRLLGRIDFYFVVFVCGWCGLGWCYWWFSVFFFGDLGLFVIFFFLKWWWV